MNHIVGINLIGLKPAPLFWAWKDMTPFYNWKIQVENSKSWFVGNPDCSIIDGNFSVYSAGGMGKASLKFSKLDFPLKSGDNIKIYYKGKLKYQGFIEGEPDIANTKIKLSPYSKKFEGSLYNYDYSSTSVTYQTIIQDVLQDKLSQTGVFYNASLLSINSTNTINPNYEYQSMKTVLNEISEQIDDRDDGVDENNFYYIKKYSTNIDITIYNDALPHYTNVTITTNDDKIKATRYQVYQKSTTTGEVLRLGQVGYDTSTGTYPQLAIENRVGIIEKKYTAPTGLNSTNALYFAYQKLISQTDVPTNIKIKNLNLNNFDDIALFKKIRIWKAETLHWNTIIDCDSTSNWSEPVSLSTDAKSGDYSITFSDSLVHYRYNEMKKWNKITKIGFWLKCTKMGSSFLTFSIGENYRQGYSQEEYSGGFYSAGTFSTVTETFSSTAYYEYTVSIRGINIWQWVETPIEYDKFRTINFANTDTSAIIQIDDISLYQYYRQYNDGNIISIDYDIGSDLATVEAGEYDRLLNDEFFKLQQDYEKQK